MGHMLKSRLLASPFANEKPERQLGSKAMPMDQVAIPRSPVYRTHLPNHQRAASPDIHRSVTGLHSDDAPRVPLHAGDSGLSFT